MLAPFGHSGLVFATILGFPAFAGLPAPLTLPGALVIAASGLYVWQREMRLRLA